MAEVQMLIPMEPKEFWSRLKLLIEEAVEQKNGSGNKTSQPVNAPKNHF